MNILSPTPKKRFLFFLLLDILISFFTLFVAYNLRFSFEIPSEFYDNFFKIFVILTILKIAFIAYFRIYKVAWRYFSLNEAKKLLYAHVISYILFTLIFIVFENSFIPFARSILIIDLLLSMTFIGILRVSKRLILESNRNNLEKPTIIIGATTFAQTLIKNQEEYNIVSIIDNDKMIIGSYFSGIKVASLNQLESIVLNNGIVSVIISKEFAQEELNKIFETLKSLNINDIKISSLKQNNGLKKLTVEDLLARHPKDLDKQSIEKFVKDKVVLITGAGGSIGSEISRKCVSFGAKQLILLDHSEFNLYTISQELENENIISVMQSVVNKEQIKATFDKYNPQIVIHAAAYKHVPLVEDNINESIINNIIGTKNIIDVSIENNIEKVVLISTDKAVRPTNVMGTTKRICELYAQNVFSMSTEIVAVRFGNVLGSSGSVIPKFRAQISSGGPITVTHPDITRYFMLIPEACELVLQAASIGKGGEIFILDMGEPIKIVDMAKKMIEISGRNDIKIEYCGLRPGEKLYEELLIDDSEADTQYESITVAGKSEYDINKLNNDIIELINTENKLEKLKEIVPEFNHQSN